MPKPRILLDLDQVLAGFVEGVCRVYGVTLDELYAEWPAGEYGINGPLAHALYRKNNWGEEPPPDHTMSESEFWWPLSGFWADLPVLPWAGELIDLVRSTTDEWFVVTSPSRCPGCVDQKREWCRIVFGLPPGAWFDRLVPTPHKYLLAGPDTLLIDDHEENCRSFVRDPVWDRNTGGHAINFPAYHNSMHTSKTDPMGFVRAALDSWLRWQKYPVNAREVWTASRTSASLPDTSWD